MRKYRIWTLGIKDMGITMRMRHYISVILLFLITIGVSGCCLLPYNQCNQDNRGNRDILFQNNQDVIFQISTIDALLEGVYDGEMTCRDIKRRGNFGIGTFHGLDGEMIVLDGNIYQIRADGLAYPADDSMKVPFALVTDFEPDMVVLLDKTIDKAMDYRQLGQYLDTLLPTKNIFYAIKITGDYHYIKTRSVPRQQKPYPPLAEVVKNQPTFEFRHVKGTIAGFWCPEYVKGVNVPLYHLHFLTEDGKSGGHLLECQVQKAKIEIDHSRGFSLALPESDEFCRARLDRDKQEELNKVEK